MSSARERVQVIREASCLRGLHYRFVYAGCIEAAQWVQRLQEASGQRLVHGVERWGKVTMHRLICQFRFEARFAEPMSCVTLLHRLCASEAQRTQDRLWLSQQLEAALDAERAEGSWPRRN